MVTAPPSSDTHLGAVGDLEAVVLAARAGAEAARRRNVAVAAAEVEQGSVAAASDVRRRSRTWWRSRPAGPCPVWLW